MFVVLKYEVAHLSKSQGQYFNVKTVFFFKEFCIFRNIEHFEKMIQLSGGDAGTLTNNQNIFHYHALSRKKLCVFLNKDYLHLLYLLHV